MTWRCWREPRSVATSTGITTRGNEIAEAQLRPVVRDLLELIRLRNSHPAFQGVFELEPSSDRELTLLWRKGEALARLRVNLESAEHAIEICGEAAVHRFELLTCIVVEKRG